MKKILASILIISFLSSNLFAFQINPELNSNQFLNGYQEGILYAEKTESGKGGYIAHYFSGLFLGFIGVGVSTILASTYSPNMSMAMMMNQNEDKKFITGFYEGYKSQSKKNNFDDALYGSLTGWGTWLIILIAASNYK